MKTHETDSSPVPSRWAWHFRQLQALRDRLLQEREEHLAEAAAPIDPPGMDIADSATDEFNHDLALGMLSHEQDALYEVDSAIHRILEGTYGVCEETGTAIPAARLRAMPWTRRTKEAEERIEQQGLEEGVRLGRIGAMQGRKSDGRSEPDALTIDEPENEELISREVARHKREASVREIEGGSGET